jgi:hypothetical protein
MNFDSLIPVCRHRGPQIRDGIWRCNSPKLVAPGGLVSAHSCRFECMYVDHDDVPGFPCRDDATLADGIDRLTIVVDSRPTSLAMAMVTAPRSRPTLAHSLETIRSAGFTTEVHVFAEPGCTAEQWDSSIAVVPHFNPRRLGAWENWRQAATFLLEHSQAEFLVLCEDDIGLATDASAALDYVISHHPPADIGYISLFTPWHNVLGQRVAPGWQPLRIGFHTWGALFYCFPRPSLVKLLAATANLPSTPKPYADWAISQACERLDLKCLFHLPSLCEHTGHGNSAVGHMLPYEAEACNVGLPRIRYAAR